METQSATDEELSTGSNHNALLALSTVPLESDPEEIEHKDAAAILESPLSTLPVQLDVCIPLPFFRVADLVALEAGRVLESVWGIADDVPLWCGDVQMVWAEFEVVDQKIAVRVTRLV